MPDNDSHKKNVLLVSWKPVLKNESPAYQEEEGLGSALTRRIEILPFVTKS